MKNDLGALEPEGPVFFRRTRRHGTWHDRIAAGCTVQRIVLQSMLSLVLVASTEIRAFGGDTRIQSFQLKKGWNAVYLAVEPSVPHPTLMFTNSPIDVAATYDGVFSPRQFTSNPAANMLRELGWGVWYAPERPDGFLAELGGIHGQKCYLLHSKSDFTLKIEGTVEMANVLWQPNAFNLVGFCLDALAPPTFAQFFSASRAHRAGAIYRLVDGTWRKVMNTENEAMRSGEAFWIYCDGSSKYQGPLQVETMTRRGLFLDGSGDELVLRNVTDHPISSVLEHVVSGEHRVPIAVVVDVIDDEVGGMKSLAIPMISEGWTTELPVIEAHGAARSPLALQTGKMTVPEARTLLRVKTDIGTEIWVPVLGQRRDLE